MPMLKLTNDLEIFGISHRHILIGASAPTRLRNFGILEGDMWNRFRNISCSGKRLSENHGIIMCSSQLNCIHPGSRIKCLRFYRDTVRKSEEVKLGSSSRDYWETLILKPSQITSTHSRTMPSLICTTLADKHVPYTIYQNRRKQHHVHAFLRSQKAPNRRFGILELIKTIYRT